MIIAVVLLLLLGWFLCGILAIVLFGFLNKYLFNLQLEEQHFLNIFFLGPLSLFISVIYGLTSLFLKLFGWAVNKVALDRQVDKFVKWSNHKP